MLRAPGRGAFGLQEFDGEGVALLLAGSQEGHALLLFVVVPLGGEGGTARPGLQAHVGAVVFGGPDAQHGELGEVHLHAPAGGLVHHPDPAGAQAVEDQGVPVEQVVAQGDLPALELVGAVLVVDQAGALLDDGALLVLVPLKLDGVVLKLALSHREVEPGVAADDVGHGLVPGVLHREGGGVALLRQLVGHGEGEVEGVAGLGGLCGGQGQGDGALPLLSLLELGALGEAVAAHGHPAAPDLHLVLPQGPYNGEEHRGVLVPVVGVRHPDALEACLVFERQQLGAQAVHLCRKAIVLDFVDHGDHPPSGLFGIIIPEGDASRKKRFALSPILCYAFPRGKRRRYHAGCDTTGARGPDHH